MLVFFYGRHFTLLAGVFAYENLRRNYTEKNWDKLKKINQLYVLFIWMCTVIFVY